MFILNLDVLFLKGKNDNDCRPLTLNKWHQHGFKNIIRYDIRIGNISQTPSLKETHRGAIGRKDRKH
jgi:hypothetical protein